MPRFLDTLRTWINTGIGPFLVEVARNFQKDNIVALSAALAYFALFSLFPLLLIIFSIVGAVVGNEDSLVRRVLRAIIGEENAVNALSDIDANQQISEFVRRAISPEVALLIDDTLQRLSDGSVEASVVGVVILFWVASTIFGQMDWAFQIIWGIPERQTNVSGYRRVALNLVKRRLLAFGLVLVSALLLLVSILLQGGITVIRNTMPELLEEFGWETIYFATAFALLFIVLLLLFKYLPRTRVAWGDIWLGAFITTILITLLVNLSSWFIGTRNFLSYGVVGTIMTLLFWIYLSSMAIYLGAEFTHVYARTFGSHRASVPEQTTAQRRRSDDERH